MPERHFIPAWRDSNARNKYPFADTATLTNEAGRFIADDSILDLSLHPIGGQTRTYLSRVVINATTITIYFGDAANRFRCSGSFDVADPPETVVLEDGFGRPAGLLVSRQELLAQFQALGLGTHDFTQAATEICASCVIPTPEVGLRGFLLDDGSVVSGDVWLVGDEGVVLGYETVTRDDGCGGTTSEHVVRVDVVGDPLFRRRLCEPISLFVTPRVLKQLRIMQNCDLIAQLTPDERGDVKIHVGANLASDTVLRVRPSARGLRLETAQKENNA